MTLDQLFNPADYYEADPTPMIIAKASLIAIMSFIIILCMALSNSAKTWLTVTITLATIASAIIFWISTNVIRGDLAQLRAEAVSQYLEQTYDVDVGFTEDGVQPDNLDGSIVRDGGSVYTIAVATDDSILLIDEGGKEVPRVTR